MLLLLLLELALALLHLLQALLGRHGAIVGRLWIWIYRRADDRWRLVGWLFRLRLNVFFLLLRLGVAAGRGAGGTGAEHDVEGLAEGLVADDEDVVIDAAEELREDVAGLSGAEIAEDAFVAGEAFHFGAGLSGDLVEDGVEAGILGDDVEAVAIERDGGRGGRIIGGPFGRRRSHRRGRGDRLRGLARGGLLGGAMVNGLVLGSWLLGLLGEGHCGPEQHSGANDGGKTSGGAMRGHSGNRSRRLAMETHHRTGFPADGEQSASPICVLD